MNEKGPAGPLTFVLFKPRSQSQIVIFCLCEQLWYLYTLETLLAWFVPQIDTAAAGNPVSLLTKDSREQAPRTGALKWNTDESPKDK